MYINTDNASLLISIGLIVYFIFCFFQGKNGTAKRMVIINDKFKIGYIECDQQDSQQTVQTVTKSTKSITPLITHEPKPVVIKPKKQSPSLQQECFRIMVAIGYSQDSAKQIVKDFFKKNTADSLEEFFVKINKP